MYEVDERDEVVELDDVPPIDCGAPLPLVVANEDRLFLAYLVSQPGSWDDPIPDHGLLTEPVAVVEFTGAKATMFGAPNDEAFEGHPLAARGLGCYQAFRVRHSSWIRRLERMNRVHRMHSPEGYDHLTHYVFAFHDSTFECVARSLHADIVPGPLPAVAAALAERVYRRIP